jgi:hypothetical protein
MKYTGRLMNHLAIFGIAFATAFSMSTAEAQVTKQGKGRVRAVEGSARYSTGGGAWLELKAGTSLSAGATITTSAQSHVDVYLGINGPTIRITEDSTVGIDKLTYTDTGADAVIETQLNLKKGTLMGSVRKLAAASRYEIKTPSGVAGIRGTDYVITDKMLLFILRGLGHVAYILPDGNILSESVSTGETFVPPGNKRPITKTEFDAYSRAIAAMNTSDGSVVVPTNFGDAVLWVRPNTGEVSPDESQDN